MTLNPISGFYSPTGIALRSAGNIYEIYISDEFDEFYKKLRVRKFSVSISEMLLDGYDASEQLSNPSMYWSPADDSMSCTLSAFGLHPDGQSVIISCPEKNQIYRHSVEENQDQGAFFDGPQPEFLKISENITGSEVPPETGYTEGIGTAATFRYPGSVSVSPDGTWAVIAE